MTDDIDSMNKKVEHSASAKEIRHLHSKSMRSMDLTAAPTSTVWTLPEIRLAPRSKSGSILLRETIKPKLSMGYPSSKIMRARGMRKWSMRLC